jgi:glycerophosphoryl diester phosphodiesterase
MFLLGSVFKYANIAAINMSSKFARSETITNLHKNGFKVFVWTVNSKTEMQKMIDLKVDGIITNYPDRLLELINR